MGERYRLKRIADSLTIFRLLIAVVVPVVSAIYGRGAIAGLAGWLFVVAWLTDTIDGQLARRSGLAGSGVCALLDPWADLFVALGGLAALYLAGFVSPLVFGIVLVAVAIGCCLVDFLVFQGLSVFFLIVAYLFFASRENLGYLIICLSLIMFGLVVFRRRFAFLWRRFFGHIGKHTSREC